MACGYCGGRLIAKSSDGLICCGCARPLHSMAQQSVHRLSSKTLLLFSVLVMLALPFVGAITILDELRAESPLSEQTSVKAEALED
jgi:hypothetical protein